ncbi:T9SS type B sorting domain-containing protein [Flagellimonas sp.]|uniref:T9SS type B sorting domain-containing protein n=1 Tax=Flagellimonas sp. TaxID=2058762 RepID=UPI003BAF2F09
MIRLLLNHFFNALKSLQVQITTIIKPEKTKALLLFVLLMGLASNNVALGQQVDTWFRAGKGVNAPTSPLNYADPNPLPPADGTPVTTWYDIVYSVEQNLFPNPNPSDYPNNPFLTPPGFDYPFPNSGSYDLYLTPTGSIPGLPTLRRNLLSNINFNPVVNFDGSGDGQALHFRSDSRQNVTVFVVFRAQGAGNSAETQRLLFGGDVENHHTSFNQDQWTTNLSLGVADGNVFSVGRTWEGDGGGFFQPGSIDLMGLPSIGTFTRSASLDSERLDTYVNGLNDIGVDRNHILADNDLFFFNRVGKHFNSNDSNRNLTGDIAEILLADFSLSTTQRQMVESYLAIKYGITLNRAGQLGSIVGNLGYSYLASDGTVIWDPTLNINYRFDIAGLGRDRFDDTVGGLSLRYDQHQRISQSVNAGTIVAMSTNTNFATDNLDQSRTEIDNTTWGATSLNSHLHNYLIWASDRGSVNQTAVELPTGYSARIEREWQIQKTVSPGGVDPINNVSVRVDLSGSDMLSNPNCGTLVLLIDNDGDGDFLTGTLTSIPATSVDGANNAYFDNVTFEHTQVFTIAFLDDEDPTASNQVSTVCDNAPAVDPDVIDDETDNCGIASVTFISETTDNLSNPETIVRTYRVTDSYGNFIDVTHTIYVYTSPVVDEPADVSACNSYVLPPLTTGSYFTGSGGTGTPLSAGDVITSTQTIYVYAATGPVPCTDEHSFTVTITPAPVVDAGSDEEICQGGAHDLSNSGTVPTESGTSSLLWSSAGDGSFDDATMLAPTYTPGVNDIANGSVVLTLTGSGNGSCGPVNDSMTLTITPAPVVDAGSDEEICQGGAHDLSNSGTVPTESGTSSLLWSSAGDGSFDDATMLAPTYTPGVNDIANGSVVLTLTGSGNGSCGPVNDSMTLTITPAPVVGAGSDEEICQGGTHDFSASGVPPSASNTSALLWQTAGDGTFSDPNILLPVYTPGANDIANGSVVLTLRGAGNGSCGPVNDSMTLTINDRPTIGVSLFSDPTSCSGNDGSITLIFTNVPNGNYDIVHDTGIFNAVPVNAGSAVVNGLTAGNYDNLRITVNGCTSTEDPDVTLTDPGAPIANAGSDGDVCGIGVGNPFATNAVAAVGTGTWTNETPLVGTATFADPNDETTNVTVDAYGTYTFRWTDVNGTCSGFDEITVTFDQQPLANAGPDQEICGAVPYVVTGASASGFDSLLWTHNGVGNFTDASVANAQYNPAPGDIGNVVTLTLTAGSSGSCTDAVDSMTLTITPEPVVGAGSDEEICQGGTHDLSNSGTVPTESGTSSLLWSSAGDGSFDDATMLAPTYTPGVNDIANGSVVLTLTGSGNGSCGPVNDSMTLTITPAPVVDAGSDEEICQGGAHDLSNSGTVPTESGTSSLLWSSAGDGSFDDATMLAPTYTPGVNDIANGSVVLTLTGSGNGSCGPVNDSMTLTITPAPVVDAGSDEEICQGGAHDLSNSGTVPTESGTSSLLWSSAGDGSFDDATMLAPTYTPGVNDIANGSVVLTLTGSGNGSCGPVNDSMTLTITPAPVVDAGSDEEICQGGTHDFSASGVPPSASNTSALLWQTAGDGTFSDPNILLPVYTPGANDIANGSVVLTLRGAGNGSCGPVNDSMTLTINDRPTIGVSLFSDPTSCSGNDGSITLIFTNVPNGNYDIVHDTGIFNAVPVNAGSAVVNGLTAGNYDNLRITVNGCTSTEDPDVTLTDPGAPIANAGSDGDVCGIGVGNPFATNAVAAVGTGTWTNETPLVGTATFADPNDETTNVTVDAYGTYTFRWTDVNGTCSGFDEITVTFDQQPLANAGPDQEICGAVPYVVTGASASGFDSLLWTHNGVGNFTDASVANAQYNPAPGDIGNVVTLTLTAGSSGSCTDAVDSMDLTITPEPVVGAGSDEEICQGGAHDLSNSGTVPTESGTSSLLWSSAGDGSFDDATMLAPTYTPGVNDIANGSVVLTLTGSGNGSCGPVNDSMTLTITPAPVVDAGSDEEICQGGTHDFSASGVPPSASNTSALLWQTAGDGTFSDPNILLPVYTPGANDIANGSVVLTLRGAGNGSCGPVNDSMELTINNTPLADAPADVESCDSYILPALANGNYFDAPNGGGNALSAGDVITATTTLYVFSPGAGSCPDVENSFVVTINNTPLADAPADVESCDSYILPALANGNYFDAPNGGGNALSAGDVITATTTLYVFSPGAGSCPDVENSFVVTINNTPLADAPADVESCDSYILPALANGNYFDAPNGGGNALSAGDVITATTTLYVFSPGAGSCPDVENSFVVTINNTPLADAPADVESCDSYILPALANGNYFDAPNGGGNALSAGDVITATTTLYVFSPGAGSCPDVENSFVVTINNTPLADAPADVESCDSYILPALANGNYFDAPNGGGNALSAGDVITATTTLYVFSPGAGSCPDVENSFVVTINNTPLADAPADVESCDSYILPALANGNYFDAPNGGGNALSAGDVITATTTLYVFSPGAGSCPDVENSFVVTINNTPLADAPADVESCDSYILPALANGNYFDAPNGGGNALSAGDVITATTTLYVFSPGAGSCPDVENSFVVTINNTPLADAPADVESCDSYILPALANGNYFDAPNGGGNALSAGDVITATTTLYVFSPGAGSCPDVENSFVVTINNTPLADAPADVESCDSYILPALANGNYFDAPNGGGNALSAGDVITATTTLYVFSPGAGSCPDVENSFVVTINNTPLADAPADVESCDSYILPALANGNYFDAPNGGGNALSAGDVITATTTLYVFSPGAGSCPDVENSFVVTINNTPLADAPADVESCDSYILPALANGNYFDAPNGGGNALSAGDVITATTTLYVFSPGAGSCPDVENSFVVTINNTPLADAPADVESCDSYILPALANGNYFDAPNGGGNALSAGDVITATTTLYVFSPGAGSCPDVENSFVVTINNTPLADAPADVESCDSYILPALANGNYFDAPNGGGNALSAGDVITATTTLYVFSPGAGSCPDVENSFVVTINNTPLADAPADVESCDSYILPALANGNYFDAPNGGGNALSAGDVITATTTLYVFSPGAGSCPDVENSFVVTINNTPLADAPADVESCDSYILPALANGNYFDAPNGGGNALSAGDVITATTTLYVFSPGAGSCPDVENSFVVTITGFSVNINIEHETCWESDNGSVFVVIGDAELPVTVQLNNMAPMVFNTDSFSIDDLSPGNYEMSVIDDTGCETNTGFSIQPGGANLGGSVDVLYSCDANLPSNTIAVTLFDPLVSNDVLYALDSTDPNDFTLSPDFVNISPGDHSLFIMDNNGCIGEIPFEVESFEPLELTLTSEYVNQITANVTGGTAPYTYYFDNNSGTDSNTYTINRSGTVTVRVVDSNGCEVFESTTMNLMEITIPNFFTPNNDGQNDFWRPRNIEQFPDIETYIFDRYGRKIWIIGPLDQGWDGTYESRPLPSGDYWYIVRLNDGTGREYVGNFTLYR